MTTVSSIIGDCIGYREVLVQLLSRDLKIKYHRTVLGYAWSLLNPMLQILVLSAVFSHIVRIGMRDYTLYLFSGVLFWGFFHSCVTGSATIFIEVESFIKKIYLPKLLFPLSRVCLRSVDFMLALVALSCIGFFLGYPAHLSLLLLPLAVLNGFIFTLGVSILIAIATVYFRDVEYLITVFMQLLYFATPIIYPVSMLPESYQTVLSLNPLFIQVRIFQSLIYEGRIPTPAEWGLALGVSFLVLGFSVWLMSKVEEQLVFRL